PQERPIGIALGSALFGCCTRESVVDEKNTVTDENLVFDLDAAADERVTGDLARSADRRSALDFDERPHACVVANTAAVEVRERPNAHVVAKFHVGDEPMRGFIGGFSGHRSRRYTSRAVPPPIDP